MRILLYHFHFCIRYGNLLHTGSARKKQVELILLDSYYDADELQ